MWSTGEGNGKPLQYSCLENTMNSMKRQNDRILKEELPRSIGAQYATLSLCLSHSVCVPQCVFVSLSVLCVYI